MRNNGPFWNSVTRMVIFSGGKMWENAKIKMRHFRKFSNSVQRSKSVIRHFICRYLSIRGSIHRTKNGEKWQNWKTTFFSKFQTLCNHLDIVGDFQTPCKAFWVPKLDKLHFLSNNERASFYTFLWLIKLFDRRSFYLKPLKVAPLTKLVWHGNDPNLCRGTYIF